MKKLLIAFLTFGSFAVFAQEQKAGTVAVNRVDQMAVYPGCEEFTGDKQQLINCFGQRISKDVIEFLDTEYPVTAETIDKNRVAAKIEFEIDTDGNIVNITSTHGDKAFENQAVDAFIKLASKMKSENIHIIPAKMENDQAVKLVFTNSVAIQNPMDEKEKVEARKKLGIQSM